jgi:hypothetical protein
VISLKEGVRQTRNASASLVIRSLPSGENAMRHLHHLPPAIMPDRVTAFCRTLLS